jgi:hypothetical protein
MKLKKRINEAFIGSSKPMQGKGMGSVGSSKLEAAPMKAPVQAQPEEMNDDEQFELEGEVNGMLYQPIVRAIKFLARHKGLSSKTIYSIIDRSTEQCIVHGFDEVGLEN